MEYHLSDTFSMLLEKCLIALNIKGKNHEASSTTRSNDDNSGKDGSYGENY